MADEMHTIPATAQTADGRDITSMSELRDALRADQNGMCFSSTETDDRFTGSKVPANSQVEVRDKRGRRIATIVRGGFAFGLRIVRR